MEVVVWVYYHPQAAEGFGLSFRCRQPVPVVREAGPMSYPVTGEPETIFRPRNTRKTRKKMKEKVKVLFICTFNKMRSKTAEVLYKKDERFEVKSAGVNEFAEVPVNLELLVWADYIVVMEEYHRKWLALNYPGVSEHQEIICLDIPDLYDFMEPELVVLLKEKAEAVFKKK
jgi:predicted protein tyrosine phosphatase